MTATAKKCPTYTPSRPIFLMRSSHTNPNLYHYARNTPVKYTDPDGRNEFDLIRADVISFVFGSPLGYICNKTAQFINDDVRNELTEQTQSKTNPKGNPMWTPLSPENSVFHQPENGDHVTKYVSAKDGGKAETCWDDTKNEVLKDPKTRATYNFGGATGFAHAFADVIPWILYGTGKDDPSFAEERLGQTLAAGAERVVKWFDKNGRLSRQTKNEIMDKYYEHH